MHDTERQQEAGAQWWSGESSMEQTAEGSDAGRAVLLVGPPLRKRLMVGELHGAGCVCAEATATHKGHVARVLDHKSTVWMAVHALPRSPHRASAP